MRGVKKYGEHSSIFLRAIRLKTRQILRVLLLKRTGPLHIRTALNASDLDFTAIWLLM